MAVKLAASPLLFDIRELATRRDLTVTADDAAARECSKPEEPDETH
jgi:hypothetical protein